MFSLPLVARFGAGSVKQYPDVDYVVYDPELWNPASTGAEEVSETTALQPTQRILCTSGPNAGIWIVQSATSATPDSSFVPSIGWDVRALQATAQPSYLVTGVAPTVFAPVSPYVTETTNELSDSTNRTGFTVPMASLSAVLDFPKDSSAKVNLLARLSMVGANATITGRLILGAPHSMRVKLSGALVGAILTLVGTCGVYGVTLTATFSPPALITGMTMVLTAPGGVTETLTGTGSTVLIPIVAPAVYYDPANGDDANSGASAAVPKRTMPAANAWPSGIVARIACGSYVQRAFVTSNLPADFERYGIGSDPIADCTIAIDVWTKLPAYTNIYYHDIVVAVPIGATGNVKVYAAGRVMRRIQNAVPATALANLDALASEAFYAEDFAAGPVTIRVYLRTAAGTAPTVGRYRVDALEAGVYVKAPSRIVGLHSYGALSNNGGMVVTEHDANDAPIFRGCTSTLGSRHNFDMCGGLAEGCVALWAAPINVVDTCFPFVFNRNVGNGVPWSLVDCAVIHDPNTPYTIGVSLGGIIGHANTAGPLLGPITVTEFGWGHGTGPVTFEGAPVGYTSLSMVDSLCENWIAFNDAPFYGRYLTVSRSRVYGAGMKLVHSTTGPFTLVDSIFTCAAGAGISTYGGFITPGGAASGNWAHSVQYCLLDCTDTVAAGSTVFYIGNAAGGALGPNYTIQMNNNLITGTWKRAVEVGAGAGPRLLPGDNNVWVNNAINMFFINGAAIPFAPGAGNYQGGWYGTWLPTDPNSVQVTATFDAYVPPVAWQNRPPFVEAVTSPSYAMREGPRVAAFPTGAWVTPRRYQELNDALYLAGVHV